jgi:hypothetical protein
MNAKLKDTLIGLAIFAWVGLFAFAPELGWLGFFAPLIAFVGYRTLRAYLHLLNRIERN